jgi:hypothetical protein
MSRRQRIQQDDLTRIVMAIRGTGLEIHSVTIDTEGSVTVAVHPQNVEAERDEARRALVALRRRTPSVGRSVLHESGKQAKTWRTAAEG